MLIIRFTKTNRVLKIISLLLLLSLFVMKDLQYLRPTAKHVDFHLFLGRENKIDNDFDGKNDFKYIFR